MSTKKVPDLSRTKLVVIFGLIGSKALERLYTELISLKKENRNKHRKLLKSGWDLRSAETNSKVTFHAIIWSSAGVCGVMRRALVVYLRVYSLSGSHVTWYKRDFRSRIATRQAEVISLDFRNCWRLLPVDRSVCQQQSFSELYSFRRPDSSNVKFKCERGRTCIPFAWCNRYRHFSF